MPYYFVNHFHPVSGRWGWVQGPQSDGTFLADTATDANGLAAIQERADGKYVAFDIADATATIEETRLASDSAPTTF